MQTLTALCALALLAFATGFVARWLLLRVVQRLRSVQTANWARMMLHEEVLKRLAKATPSLMVQLGVQTIPYLQPQWRTLIGNLAVSFTIYHFARVIGTLLDAMNQAHEREEARKATQTRSIKSYVQLGKLLVYMLATVLIVATLVDRSPLLLLSGLGAASAVLMLVFKDTIMSFVAGVLLGSNDMLRVGDWIEMPQVGADGFVIDIALHTVKVQNWDKTITTVPTWRLMSDSYKNWRGMFESGGRRIRRAMSIDAHSIHLLTPAEYQRLASLELLQNYWNSSLHGADPRQASNLAAFKAYVQAYLVAHPGIHKAPNMFMLVRTMEPTAMGVPLEIYCYTATTVWVEYEAIQGQVFDHLISMLPEFGLCLYQRSSDYNQHYPAPSYAERYKQLEANE
ncbi:mechanosensitive ion channel family protein [Comamonas composti]|uniref:mechanosensitive ion channel family protein n=1 Tax=Comamonas composti TaxID=408558 RepID=UPI00054D475B|nr:mechanosensitive ion channel domain-containing protein [Comamonas composti]